ncbi:hypothetical protein M404DRAFT_1006745 [Pisolithus tinctorius Marx 270]|uniref:Uncharacterized protein n=1 Tax=Pisolithus tinctorius Marx 270 TaxID=870435 RepID=A0A0C3NLH3_PISTI|nr:hypothetical protein M404DRAFT_1006745 [Pisolithus tinctorius Marx 270]
MTPQSASGAGEMQPKTIIGIILGITCFIILVLSSWTISYWFQKRANRRRARMSSYPPRAHGDPSPPMRFELSPPVTGCHTAPPINPSGTRSPRIREVAISQRQALEKAPPNSNGT